MLPTARHRCDISSKAVLPGRNDAEMGPGNSIHASAYYSEYNERFDFKKLVQRWRKRGISCVPTKFGIAFTAKYLNQAGALVHVYKDGSVLLNHGGTEMGQGLHTKMTQVALKYFLHILIFFHKKLRCIYHCIWLHSLIVLILLNFFVCNF